MKLLDCHIENFGAFHDFDLSFTDGLNVVMQPNGWGKTTLAAFVKAMFYGFDGKRVRDVSENERLRYKPWQGGKYGGYLDFEADGREFRVTRSFGDTRARDRFKIVDLRTGTSAASEVGENLGEWLFGIDANAFQKSVYVVQNGLGYDGSSASLRNRLNSLVNEADDVAGLDAAFKALDERRKFYKKTGDRGRIAEISTQMAGLVGDGARAAREIASLKEMQAHIEELDSQVLNVDRAIAQTENAAEEERGKRQEREALLKVRDQLRGEVAAARASYEDARKRIGGAELSHEEIDGAVAVADSIERTDANLRAARADLEVAREKQASTLGGLSSLPGKEELDKRRRQADELALRLAAAGREAVPTDEDFLALSKAVAEDPSLVVHANEAAAGYDAAAAALERVSEAKAELVGVRAGWAERRVRIARLADEAKAAIAAAEGEVDPSALRQDAAELRRLSAKLGVEAEQADAAETELTRCRAEFKGDLGFDWETFAKELENNVFEARTSEKHLDEARSQLESAESEAAELRAAWQKAAKVAEERPSEQQVAKPAPAPAFACIALGAALVVAGLVLGTLPALLAAGAVVLVAGVALLARSSKNEGPASPAVDDAADQAVWSAKQRSDAAQERVTAAQAACAKAEAALAAAEGELRQKATAVFPEASLGDDLLGKCDALARAARDRGAAAKNIVALEANAAAARGRVDEAREQISDIVTRYEGLSLDADRAAAALDEKAALATVARNKVADSQRSLGDEVRLEVGDCTDPWEFVHIIDSFTPAREKELLAVADESAREVAQYREGLNRSLATFGLAGIQDSELAIGRERLLAALDEFSRKSSQANEASKAQATQMRELDSLRKELETWSRAYGVNDASLLTEQWFDDMAAAVSNNEKAAWECSAASGRVDKAGADLVNCMHVADTFIARCGGRTPNVPSQVAELVRALAKDASKALSCGEELNAAATRLDEWSAQNAAPLAEERQETSEESASTTLLAMRARRDDLVRQRAQAEEQRSAVLVGLEGHLASKQQTELLSKERQKATASLFTVQTTARYLDEARKGLDGRYLGDLGCRFEDYAGAWLVDEQIDAEVTNDFGISLYDGKAAHDVAGYSSGYRDLLDMCLRMALVDTVFQAEAPMLILDDPFSALDEQKLRRAFRLLDTLAMKFQIIYFTCHPSRVEGALMTAGEDVGVAPFVLPEQHEHRELPRARAKREAEERARAQAELVASFKIAPVTQGKASIRPDAAGRTVASNLFQVGFEPDADLGTRDNAFEVFFIDEKGRALCDRQTVQVLDGQVVPDRVRFDLTSRADSGETYELIIHEVGRAPEELAARIPFKVRIAFANDLFDM